MNYWPPVYNCRCVIVLRTKPRARQMPNGAWLIKDGRSWEYADSLENAYRAYLHEAAINLRRDRERFGSPR